MSGMLALVFGLLLVADAPNVDKVRECCAWCVNSYSAEQWSESISCIDSCQRGTPNHPTTLCAKGCVSKHALKKPEIVACIDRCSR